jgi:hypothetical protein
MRRLAAVTGLLVLGLAIMASPAGAIEPRTSTFADSTSFVIDDICEFPIEINLQVQGTARLFFDRSGNAVREDVHVSYQGTWTNRDSGKSVIEHETVNFRNDPITGAFEVVGLNWHFSLPSGRTVVIDAGRLILDAEGNIVFEAGKHQIQDTEFQVLCPFLI